MRLKHLDALEVVWVPFLAGQASGALLLGAEVDATALVVLGDEGAGTTGWSWGSGRGGGWLWSSGGWLWSGSSWLWSSGGGGLDGGGGEGGLDGGGSWDWSWGTRDGSVPDSWAWDLVLGGIGVVEVEDDSWVVARVSTDEVEVLWWLSGSTGGDLDLRAGWVELSSTGGVGVYGGVGLVVGNNLGTEEVVTGSEGAWELNRVLSAIGYESLDSPLSIGESLMGNLGPDGSIAVGGSLSNVDKNWAQVREIDDVVSSVVVVPFNI